MIRPRPGESFRHVSRTNGGIAGATNHRRCGGIYLGIVSAWDVWSRPVERLARAHGLIWWHELLLSPS
jgi:hypothetical protein